ncbi:hypothetical protein FACS189459_3570 [Bacilli bacterium]|nr:hypothetical protein FACS189459_3570 [Bacilli bacterium]
MSTTKNNFYENVTTKLVSRRSYGKVFSNFKPQDLLEIQRNSYDTFLKKELPEVIKSYFPISHPKNPKYEIIYNGLSYAKEPIVSEKLCHEFSKTYEKAVYVDVSLINRETGEVKREDKPGIFFGKIPLMTSQGTFLINGTEKIIISQIIRSPGVYALSKSKISLNKKKKVNEGNILEIFPSRGNLSNIFIDKTNIEEPTLKIMIRNSLGDAAPTFYVTTILKAFGLSEKTILDIYDSNFLIKNTLKYDIYNYKDILVDPEIVGLINSLSGKKSSSISNNAPIENKLRSSVSKYLEIKDSANKNKIESALDVVITEKAAKDLILGLSISTRSAEINFTEKNLSYQNVICATFMDKRYFDLTIAGRRKIQRKLKISERLFNNAIAEDLILTDGKVLFQKNQLILKDEIDAIKDALEQGKLNISKKINFSEVCDIQKKHINSFEKISISIENNGEIVTLPILGVPNENNNTSLTTSDFIAFISYLIGIPENVGCVDDKDHIGNKRLRLIHEQLRNVLNQAMARVNKFAMDKLASASVQTANDEQKAKNDLKTTVKSVINTKPFQNSIHAFFNTYQLTQYVGQENPLSELTNKRRVSAMGIGGISRDDPNLDIRDIHHSYYGRICPTESPEGANIGLINSLALYAKVDEETGFITSPYHKVVDGKVTEEIE